jgi:hypothetical protein
VPARRGPRPGKPEHPGKVHPEGIEDQLVHCLVEGLARHALHNEPEEVVVGVRVLVFPAGLGDRLRCNARFPFLVVAGGFDEDGRSIPIPLSGLNEMTEVFRQRLTWFVLEHGLHAKDRAQNLLSWRNSGFRSVPGRAITPVWWQSCGRGAGPRRA